jgi:ABC-type uncharacterized transport system permease subunit
MRHVRYLPFTFLSGAHGFALFAPYLIVVLVVGMFRGRRRLPTARLVPVDSQPAISN